jgi:hypothetical protein
MFDTDGTLEYAGVFVPSEEGPVLPDADLRIDVKATGTRAKWVYFREQIMPIVHLLNGTILIPSEASEAAKQKLEYLNKYHL